VFVGNLPVPVVLAEVFGRRAEFQAGMVAAILTALVLGHCAIAFLRPLRAVLVCGGVGVGLLQMLFVPHVFAGVVAIRIVDTIVHPTSDFGIGFWLTLGTGGVLITAALIFGSPFAGLGTGRTDGAGEPN
jgi:hypothetical protein